jgi:cell division protein FtsI/penicillin-binding protein 2
LYKFGLGSTTGLPLNGEKAGLVPHPTTWDKYTISRVSYGYSIDCTPVQLARAYCALANRGELPELRLIDHAVDPETGEVIEYPYGPKHRIFSKKTGEEVVKMMIAVTEPGGTATKAAIPGYHVAGKTGTANKLVNNRYVKGKNITSFVSAFPASAPKYALMVIIDDPKPTPKTHGFVTSGWNACPTGGKIISRVAPQLNVRPNFDIAEQREKILKK